MNRFLLFAYNSDSICSPMLHIEGSFSTKDEIIDFIESLKDNEITEYYEILDLDWSLEYYLLGNCFERSKEDILEDINKLVEENI
jgi:hypothetical protein